MWNIDGTGREKHFHYVVMLWNRFGIHAIAWNIRSCSRNFLVQRQITPSCFSLPSFGHVRAIGTAEMVLLDRQAVRLARWGRGMTKVNTKSTHEGTGVHSGPADQGEKVFVSFLSSPMRSLKQIVTEIAPTDIPVLLVGESGCGKEVFARQIHRLSQRRDEPFYKLICADLTAEKINHLFRHADASLPATRAGTIFLDELSDLDLVLQPKLLHFLPDGSLVPCDGALTARIVSSTVKNLEEEIRKGRFREELYYRLNGVSLRLPPLRSRKDDIRLLAEFFSERYAKKFGRPKPMFSSQALQALEEYAWPGNIRQLENAMKKVVALGNPELALRDLHSFRSSGRAASEDYSSFSLKQAARAASRQAERELILKALERTHWNRKRAAQDLRVSYKALLNKLKQMGFGDSAGTSNSHGEKQ